MNEAERVKWERTRQKGKWLFIGQSAVITAVGIILFELLLGSGYTALKHGNWDMFCQAAQALAWRSLLIRGFVIGTAVGYSLWKANEKKYSRPQS